MPDKELYKRIAHALKHQNQVIDIYTCSWGPRDTYKKLFSLAQPLKRVFEVDLPQGRGGLGNLYVFAAGNDGQSSGNINYSELENSRHVITAVSRIDRL